MRRYNTGYFRTMAWLGAVAVLWAGWAMLAVPQAEAQQMGPKLWQQVENPWLGRLQQEAYANYGEEAYRNYKREIQLEKQYDFLGNYLMEGFMFYRQSDARPGQIFLRGDEPVVSGGSFREFEGDLFGGVIINSDSFRGWSGRLTAGDNIRTKFTSLTLNLTRMAGVRLDLASKRHKFTAIEWRGTNQPVDPNQPFSIQEARPTAPGAVRPSGFEVSPVENIGLHWESTFGAGEAIRIGGTFINQHQANVTLGSRRNGLRGTLPTSDMHPPMFLIVRFEDDSQADGEGGAAVFEDQFILRVDYEATTSTQSDTTVVIRAMDIEVFDAEGNVTVIPGAQRIDVGNVFEADGARHVAGENSFIEYRFPIDNSLGNVVRARWEAVVANDYRISIAQVHSYFNTAARRGEGEFEERETRPYVVDRAPGNVKDLSNKNKVRFDYGFTTGQSIIGWNLDMNLVGLKITGEFNNNWVFAQYPTINNGKKLTYKRSTAWYVNVLKQVGFLTAGFEYFHVGANYGGGYNGEGRDLKQHRAGVILYTDKAGKEENPNDRNTPITQPFPLIDDNDDLDQWADDDDNDSFGLQGNQDSGVFPGQDADMDGVRDDDRDGDGIVDWDEPFLLYYSDPLPFIYGDDFNNNGVIDVRENDEKPDMLYDRDLEGPHWFVAGVPVDNMELTLGVIRQREPSRGGKNEMTYFKGTYRYDLPRLIELDVRHDTKRVRDDIPNHVYDIEELRDLGGPAAGASLFDVLSRRNSLISTSWLGTRIERIDNLNIINNFKWTRNHQLPGTFRDSFLGVESQTDAVVNDVTTSHRMDYTWYLGNLVIKPQFKMLWRRLTRDPKTDFGKFEKVVEEVRVAPILRVDYHITPRTAIRLGQQGFRLGFSDAPATRDALAYKLKDKVNPENDLSRTDSLIMFSNVTEYWGYKLAASIGFHRTRIQFDDPETNALRQQAFNRFFIEIVTGY